MISHILHTKNPDIVPLLTVKAGLIRSRPFDVVEKGAILFRKDIMALKIKKQYYNPKLKEKIFWL